MKKHDEGYILAYVFVILVVICLIAVSVLTIPLTNLRLEKAAITKMQQQYDAQGMIEKALAQIADEMDAIQFGDTTINLSHAQESVEKCESKQMGILYQSVDESIWAPENIKGDGFYVTSPIVWSGNQTYKCAFTVTAVSGSVMISMDVELQNVIIGTTIQKPKIAYTSYRVSTFTPPAVDAQEGGGQNEA